MGSLLGKRENESGRGGLVRLREKKKMKINKGVKGLVCALMALGFCSKENKMWGLL